MLRVAIQKEPAAELVLRLIDRDVRAGHVGVADEQRRRRQSRKPAANNMRLHPPSVRTREVRACRRLPTKRQMHLAPNSSARGLAQREQ